MSTRQARTGPHPIGGKSNKIVDRSCPVKVRFVGTALLIAAAGCASPAPPKPPSLNLPALATDVRAERMGSQVRVHWTTPSKTSDNLPIKGPITAELCREVGARPLSPAARLTACTPVGRIPVTPGSSETTDDLPAALQSDPVTLLTYRVQLFNAAGHSAGESAVAGFAAAGTAPPAVEDLHASNLEAGAVLEWQPSTEPGLVEFARTDLTPPARHEPASKPPAPAASDSQPPADKENKAKKKKGKAAHPAASHPPKPKSDQVPEVHLRIDEPTVSKAQTTPSEGTVDLTAQMGSTYRYVANRVRSVTLGTHKLEIESTPSAAATFAHLDIFPPRRPTGLEAISSSDPQHPFAIDLSWEPNAEADLAGYLVYRQTLDANGEASGPALLLTPAPIQPPAFRDLTAVSGQSYAYQVTAVDQTGNRSPLSDRSLQTGDHK